jgi:predicted MPP superfamily phosphohydrolase
MATHLVIGDPHCNPKANNDRFLWAGKLARDLKPDTIICMGDLSSMDSLSSYDRGKKSFEGRRYKKDIDHAHDALEKFNKGLNGKRPRKVMLLGNHEDRIDRIIDETPELDGTISTKDLNFKEYGWEVIPYQKPLAIDGVHYCHNYPTGVMGKPVSGDNIARSLLLKNKVSSTVGHCHLFDYSICTTPLGRKVMGLSAGCYLHHKEEYAKSTQRLWWSGLIIKRNVHNGEYDIETIEYNSIKRKYGRR